MCGHSDVTRLSSRGQYNDPANAVLCTHDGFVYLSPRMDAAGYAAYYAQSYEEEYRVEQGDAAIRPVYGLVVDRLAPHLSDAPTTALSVGAGLGSILHLLKDRHPTLACAAIEPTPGAQRHLREVKGFDVVAGDIESDWDVGREGHYDVIIMRHVLEHLLDIKSALDRIRTSLSGGRRRVHRRPRHDASQRELAALLVPHAPRVLFFCTDPPALLGTFRP